MEGTQTFALKIRDFDMSYVLGKYAYFSQEERHKQGEPFFLPGFQKFSYSEVRYTHLQTIKKSIVIWKSWVISWFPAN